MSAPFLIFMAALAAVCAWALVSRSLLLHRAAGVAKAEAALDTRMTEFRDRVKARNDRIQAEQAAAAEKGEKSEGKRYLKSALEGFEARARLRATRFAGGGHVRAITRNGVVLWVEPEVSGLHVLQMGEPPTEVESDYMQPVPPRPSRRDPARSIRSKGQSPK